MTARVLAAPRILTAEGWLDGHALMIEDGIIQSIVPQRTLRAGSAVDQVDTGMLIPGFCDTQVNGGGGVLFNQNPTVEGIRAIASAHRRYGTTALLPTLISAEFPLIRQAIAAVGEAIEQGVPGVVGIHIEGPFLNRSKRGIHDEATFRTLDDASVEMLSSLANGKTLVTLAPELAPAGLIRELVGRGVIVAAGHSLASFEAMQAAQAEGLTGVTHLFNAMSQFDSRAPGLVGAALDSPLVAGLILDGHHVHQASARVALRAKGPRELMLVTDAMPTVGSSATSFELDGNTISVAGGALRSAAGTLAGSTLDMAGAVRNCMAMLGTDLATASVMASETPARFLGLGKRQGRIAAGQRADLVLVSEDIEVERVWIGGREA